MFIPASGYALRTALADFNMIITRSPLRVSLGGGGTDLQSYSREHGGFVIAAEKTRLRQAMCEKGLLEVRFRFDFEGTRIASHD
jgi:galactokinase/mevalonate kinase-like predicted kinase